ncbi:MAG: SRPBCC domain-containing protein [Pirellulaceae bacterium]|nr:SRPBCC domain-containing protein [Pirellulaceae bacterium]
MSKRNYTVQIKIKCLVSDVFNAVVDENKICNYFVDRTSGPLAKGDRVVWSWQEWGEFPVVVKEIVPNELIHLQIDSKEWQKTPEKEYKVEVYLEFQPVGEESTMLSISEQGWLTDATGLKGSHDNCAGWTHMAMCLKAYVEHGLDLR